MFPLMGLLDAMHRREVEASVAAMDRHLSEVAAAVETVMYDGEKARKAKTA